EMTGRAGASQRGNGQHPRPLADRVHDPAPGMTRDPVSTGNWAKYCGGLDGSGGRNTGGWRLQARIQTIGRIHGADGKGTGSAIDGSVGKPTGRGGTAGARATPAR